MLCSVVQGSCGIFHHTFSEWTQEKDILWLRWIVNALILSTSEAVEYRMIFFRVSAQEDCKIQSQFSQGYALHVFASLELILKHALPFGTTIKASYYWEIKFFQQFGICKKIRSSHWHHDLFNLLLACLLGIGEFSRMPIFTWPIPMWLFSAHKVYQTLLEPKISHISIKCLQWKCCTEITEHKSENDHLPLCWAKCMDSMNHLLCSKWVTEYCQERNWNALCHSIWWIINKRKCRSVKT